MAEIISLRGDWPEISIQIETSGRLDLGNVAAFMQQLNKLVRRSRPAGAKSHRIEIVYLESGSLKIKLAVLGVTISAAALVVQVADALKTDPPAARATYNLIEGDNATFITVEAHDISIPIGPDDVEELQGRFYNVAAARAQKARPRTDPNVELLTGPQTGIVKSMDGERWIAPDSRPGLTLRIDDRRDPGSEPLEPNFRYRLDGEAHIGREGAPSYFVLHKAFRLE